MTKAAGGAPAIGLSGQYAAVDEYLTGRENLVMIGRLYHLWTSGRRRRAPTSCSSVHLIEDALTVPPRPTPGGCAGVSTWPARWSRSHR